MRSIVIFMLVAAVLEVNSKEQAVTQVSGTQRSVDYSAAKLFDRTLKARHLYQDLENTTFGKPSSISLPRTRLATKATTVLNSPALQQQEQKGTFWKAFDEELWNFVQGGRERKWNPDRRPESQKGKHDGPGEGSQLSWSGQTSAFELEKMAQRQHAAYRERSNALMQDLPLGSAATALFGESAKADAELDAQILADLDKRIRIAKVPEGDQGKIDGPVALSELIMQKYGKYHDVDVIRNSGQVAFNIYVANLGQASFRYTEGQYLQKLESILSLLNDLEQTWYIKEFLTSPIKPRKGLPSTPRSDTAVTVNLNQSPTWDDIRNQDIVEAWFMLGNGQRIP